MAGPRSMPFNPKTSWRDVFFILFRQKTKLVLFFCLILAAVTVSTFLSPSIYRAQAKILFKIGRESLASDPTLTAINPILSVGQSRDAEIQSEIEILTSEELAAFVVDKFGPKAFLDPGYSGEVVVDDDFLRRIDEAFQGRLDASASSAGTEGDSADTEKREEAVKEFLRNLVVKVSNKSNIVTISMDAFGPDLARGILEALLEVFAQKHIQVYRSSGSLAFFKEEAESQRVALEAAEAELKALKIRSGVGNVSEHVNIVMERIKGLRTEIVDAQAALAASRAMLASLQDAAGSMPERITTQEKSGVANVAADAMREKLFELRLQEQRLANRYQDQAPPVVAIRREIARAEAALSGEEITRTEATRGVNEVHQDIMARIYEVRANVDSTRARLDSLDTQVDKANAELRRTTALESKVVQLERRIGIMRENYLRYVDKMEQARITSALEHEKISNISIVQAPFAAKEPIAPARLLNIGIGFLLAFFGSFGVAYLAEFQDHTLKKPEEVETLLDIPVLASVTDLSVTGKGRPQGNPVILNRADGVWGIPRPVRESFKLLRDSICIGDRCHGTGTTFMVTSTQRREGATSIAVNLAFGLTADGTERVLLVDANMPYPGLDEVFGVERGPGLSSLLLDGAMDDADAVLATSVPNLDLLPAGRFDRSTTMLTEAKLFESERFANLLAQWRERYHYIVFDAPPLGNNSGALRLSNMVDGALWVIEAEGVHRHAAYYIRELLRQINAPLLGGVLNRRRFYVPRWLYGK